MYNRVVVKKKFDECNRRGCAMSIKISRKHMKEYEIIVDNIYTYRTLSIICNENIGVSDMERRDVLRKYAESKEKLINWLYKTEEKYNVKLFGNRYSIYPAELEIVLG